MSNLDKEKLFALHGITQYFIDAWGQHADIREENLSALLAAMGYAVDDEAQLHQQVETLIAARWNNMLEPVYSSRVSEPVHFCLRIVKSDAQNWLDWHIDTEQGGQLHGAIDVSTFSCEQTERIDGQLMGVYAITLPIELPCGYHQLSIQAVDQEEVLAHCCYIVAPLQAYKPPNIANGLRVWGVTVQLYALRSQRNWGVGDFTDLAELVRQIAHGGGGFVGLNPLHALYPAWPEHASPYSPSSRRWLNIIYIDVEAINEFKQSLAAEQVADDAFQQRLDMLRRDDWVDYSAVMGLKLSMLQLVFRQFKQLPLTHSRCQQFLTFTQQEGELLHAQATFDALQISLKQSHGVDPHWNSWPIELQSYHSEGTQTWARQHDDEVEFFAWLQWIAAEQLAEVGQQALAAKMALGLYCDVAVGVSSGSQEAWRNRQIYNLNSHIGAPPDVLGPLGQDWGLPPPDPLQLKMQYYRPLKEVFQRNMASCGALRIDHVMGLLRLWWVPIGHSAQDGAYVQYPLDDLLAVLVLESHRQQCLVVGEDLGTVPLQIYEQLQRNGIHSYRVFFFSQAPDGGFISPHHYPEQAMAALTTHDMATLKGFWHCDDLILGEQLGLYPDATRLQQLFDNRLFCKQQILNSLHGHHAIPDWIGHDAAWVPMDRTLNYAMQLHMANGCSALLSLQLEDWLEMSQPVNVPGTSDEYPNWRRKLSMTLEDMFEQPHIQELMRQLSEARIGATP
ncbi:4-alpha-glucanotransferase [Celerinatantimonas yamalensis]|uniref:4-alpha-glucanotransferase n=1 Tax=Celerinatantimonas yamalensis TaxID=559956 RepID=A0ABW9G1Y0_9GAMM